MALPTQCVGSMERLAKLVSSRHNVNDVKGGLERRGAGLCVCV
jgi:hypothetical protein